MLRALCTSRLLCPTPSFEDRLRCRNGWAAGRPALLLARCHESAALRSHFSLRSRARPNGRILSDGNVTGQANAAAGANAGTTLANPLLEEAESISDASSVESNGSAAPDSAADDPQKWRATAEPKRKEKEEKLELPDFFEIDTNPAALNLLFQSAEMLKKARHYEVVFLVHEDHVDQLEDVIQKVKDFIEEKKGKIHRLNDWGMRKLAYKIKKARRANYILMNIQINAEDINDFKTLLDKDERVIRHLVITMKKAETAQTMPPPEFSKVADEGYLDDEEELEENEDVEEEDDNEEDQEIEVAKEEVVIEA